MTHPAGPQMLEVGTRPRRVVSTRRVVVSSVFVLLASTGAATFAASPQVLIPTVDGLQDAGLLTEIMAPMTRALRLVCAVGAVGALVVAVLLGPRADGRAGLHAAAARWAAAWALATVASLVFDLSQGSGIPLADLVAEGGSEALRVLARQVQALLLSAWLAALVSFLARRVDTHRGSLTVSGVALAALIPPALVGHSGGADVSWLATTSLLVHVVAVTVWTGGLLALCAHVSSSRLRQQGDLVARFSTLALGCYVAVGVSGIANAAARATPAELWDNRAYLGLLAVKLALFTTLGGFGWLHRRRFVRRSIDGMSPRFWSLAAVEVLLMVTALGIAVVLTHTAPGMPGH